jgi:hypothetical protein
MPTKQILIVSCICIIIAFTVPVNANQNLESPPILKTYVASSPADDLRFFEQISDLLMPHSGSSIPKEPDVTHIQVFSLIGSSYNVEDSKTAQDFLSFLFYTGKAGEVYQQYLDARGIGLTPSNPGEIYDLSHQYYLAAKGVYEKCKECSTYLPEFVMYSLPMRGMPEALRETYTQATTPVPSDPSKPYNDERFGILADEWLYAHLLSETDAGYVEGDLRGAHPSVRILRGNGPSQAQQIYMSAMGMNFSPEIHAYVSELISFFYAISQAGAEFNAFENEKILPTTITKGRPEYERASGWYKAAQDALERSGLVRQGVKLPVLPSFDAAYRLPLGVDPRFQNVLTPFLLSDQAREIGLTPIFQ